MKLYRIVVYVADVPTGGEILPESTPIAEIIEFTLDKPPADATVFSLVDQYRAERAEEEREEDARLAPSWLQRVDE